MFGRKKSNGKDDKNEKTLVVTTKSSFLSGNNGRIVQSTSMRTITQQTSVSTEIRTLSTLLSASEPSFPSTSSNFTIGGSNFSRGITNYEKSLRLPTDSVPYKSSPPRSILMKTYQSPAYYSDSKYTPSNTQTRLDEDENQLKQKLEITVNPSKKFYDDQAASKVPLYTTRSKKRGKLLLINNINFIKEKSMRKGAEIDEVNLVKLFKQIGFEITNYRNLNQSNMQDKIRKFRSNSNLKYFDITAVIIMSHGTGSERSDSTQVVCADEKTLEASSIIDEFNKEVCSYLAGKPKIFIFQCCRGANRDIQFDASPFNPLDQRKLSDTLICYSTVPGFVSHRDPEYGTWYIQAICKVFMEHAHDTDVESMLKIVDHMLSKIGTAQGSRQTSSFENRGFKTCYLHPKLWQ